MAAQSDPLYLDYPGLWEAEQELGREVARIREVACSDVPLELCDIEVQQFRLRHWQTLALVGNPFVVGGIPEPEHILQFLWTVSVQRAEGVLTAEEFAESFGVEEQECGELAAEIQEYIADAFMDAPGGNSHEAPTTCTTVAILHEMETSYPRLSRAEILDMNLGEIFQRLRLSLEAEYRAAGQRPPPTISRIDKLRGAVVRGEITL